MSLELIHSRLVAAPSPHHGSRHGLPVCGIIMHYTAAGKAQSSIKWFQMPEYKVSAHFVVSREGKVHQCVALNRAAWHAGRAEMELPNGEITTSVNSQTIGIELANWGALNGTMRDGFHGRIGTDVFPYEGPEPIKASLEYDTGESITRWWEPYPDEQIEALIWLVNEIGNAGYLEAAGRHAGHEDVCLPRAKKQDPGPLFPWDRFTRTINRTTATILGGPR